MKKIQDWIYDFANVVGVFFFLGAVPAWAVTRFLAWLATVVGLPINGAFAGLTSGTITLVVLMILEYQPWRKGWTMQGMTMGIFFEMWGIGACSLPVGLLIGYFAK